MDHSGYGYLLRARWFPVIRECFDCYDFDKCSYKFLPGSGGYYDQDEETLLLWNAVIDSYNRAMRDEDFLKMMAARKGKNG